MREDALKLLEGDSKADGKGSKKKAKGGINAAVA